MLDVAIRYGPYACRRITLTQERWEHVVERHPELDGILPALRVELAQPYLPLPGRRDDENWFYLKKVGPTRWLKVVVVWEEHGDGRIITMFPQERHAMTLTVGEIEFDNIDYDENADVLYLHVGDPSSAVEFDETPEGHGVRFDRKGRIVGLTLVRPKHLLLTRGGVRVTLVMPTSSLGEEQLSPVLG